MKKLTSIISFLIVFVSINQFAFGQISVTGQIKDGETKENLPYCKVVALAPNDSIVMGGFTDDKGFFKLPLNPGKYNLVISFYGYESDTVQTDYLREDSFLGVFKLKAEVVEIDGVNVQASSRIDMIDRDVQVITNEQKLGSTAAKDVLNKVAGITYDDYTGKLKVDNDENILVLVNGVEKSQEYVQNLEPERLLRVETTRDPGGRYGLEGYSAIVNVILKDDYKGTELYVEAMSLVDINDRKKRLDWMVGGVNAMFNYTANKLNLYAGVWTGRRNFLINTTSETNYLDGVTVLEKLLEDDANGDILEYEAEYTLGFDYRINPKHTISFESNISGLPKNGEEYEFNYRTEVYKEDSLIDHYDFFTKNKSRTFNIYNTLFYIAELNKKNRLNINFTYSNYKSDFINRSTQSEVYEREEEGTNRKQFTRLYAEYEHIFSKKTNIMVGYGNTWRELNNNFDIEQRDLATLDVQNAQNVFKFTDMRHKLYSNFSWKMSSKWSMRIGIAGETSSPRTADQQYNYFIYQPLFDLRYVAGKKLNFKLKYRTLSSYPSISETNPFKSQVNPRVTSVGNPSLKPSTFHRFSLRMNAWQGLLSVEPYFNISNNSVENIGELDSLNIFNFRYENADYRKTGVDFNFSKFFDFSMFVQANLEFYHAKITSSVGSNELVDWRADVQLMYIHPKSQTVMGLNYQRRQTKRITGLGHDKSDVDFWMLLVKQPLFKQRGSIMFGYFLPIDFGVNYNQDSWVDTNGFRQRTDNDVSLVKNMFIVEFTYRFNKGKSVKRTQKNIEKETENGGGGVF